METFAPILFLLWLGIPISAAVRLVAALGSERIRDSISRHRVVHAIWFAAALGVIILTFLLSPLKRSKPHSRSTGRANYSKRELIGLSDSLTAPQPPVHPVFGKAHRTVALDEMRGGSGSMFEGLIGRSAPPPPPGIRTNLLVGGTRMLWSAGGYLYFHLLSSNEPLWEFAPCGKTNLNDITLQDVSTRFVRMGDRTNGPLLFGTNWLKQAIQVHQGQLILARRPGDEARTYALQITKQERESAVVDYLEVPR